MEVPTMHTAKHVTKAKNHSGSGFTLPEFMMAVLAGSLLITGSVALRSMSRLLVTQRRKPMPDKIQLTELNYCDQKLREV